MIPEPDPNTKMADLLRNNLNLLFVLNQFSIPLGFGEKTIREVCAKNGIDTLHFLALIQLHRDPAAPDFQKLNALSPEVVLYYLKKSHTYFTAYRLPEIKKKFASALEDESSKKTILTYFEEYRNEVVDHMGYENNVFFPYVEKLLKGEGQDGYSVRTFETRHNNIEEKLDDLINLIIKYLPTSGETLRLGDVLEDLRRCNKELNIHTFLEDKILVPQIKKLEKKTLHEEQKKPEPNEELSEREKDIVRCVARGLSNKETAEAHFISIHTVITHRRNISRKLGIHSTAGLTVYAILNKLINIEELK